MKQTKGQSAVEFVVLVSFMIIIFFIFFIILQNKMLDAAKNQDVQYLKEANNIVLNEIEMAQKSPPDYTRSFNLPDINGKRYQTQLFDNRELVSSYESNTYVNFLPINITGELHSDQALNANTIYKTDGLIVFDNGTLVDKQDEYAGLFMNVNPERCFIANATSECSSLLYCSDCETYFNLCEASC